MAEHRGVQKKSSDQAPQAERRLSAPRSAWDAYVETLRIFGGFAPYLVFAALIAFGFYKYSELQRKAENVAASARAQAENLYRDQIANGTKALVEVQQSLLKVQQNFLESERKLDESNRKRRESEELVASLSDKIAKLNKEFDGTKRDYEVAIQTLGAFGALVEDVPELLRAVGTKEAVRAVLARSEQLFLEGQVGNGGLYSEYLVPKVHILLAFADLQGFLGDVGSEEKLSAAALGIISGIRARAPQETNTSQDMISEEAIAHKIWGDALGRQKRDKLEAAIAETNKSIAIYQERLSGRSADSRMTTWQLHEGEAYVQLARQVGAYRRNRTEIMQHLETAIAIFDDLVQKDPGDNDPVRKQRLAWAHWHVGEVETEFQNLDSAKKELEQSLKLMNSLGEKIQRSNDWRDWLARTYNRLALVWLEEARRGGSDVTGAVGPASQGGAVKEALDMSLDQLNLVINITADLARDESNLAAQTVHAWSLHNRGEIRFARAQMLGAANELDNSVADFRQALVTRQRLVRLAPKHAGWLNDASWTKRNLNRAEAAQAKRAGKYAAALDLLRDNLQRIEEELSGDRDNDNLHHERAVTISSCAEELVFLKQDQEARELYSKAKAIVVERKAGLRQEGERRRWDQLADRVDRAVAKLQESNSR